VTLSILPADSPRAVRRFVDVPWQIPELRAHPRWVPPLRLMVHDVLDARRNHFYRRGARALWIAERDGRPVGRIAAIENRAHNEFHGDRTGFFGFFECRDDVEAATRLIETASTWLAARGLTSIRGPVSPSTNHECGVLVDGVDEHPAFMTTWNPPYYTRLLEKAGLVGVKDLLGYELSLADPEFRLPDAFEAHARRAMAKQRVDFRDLEPRHWKREVAVCWEVYNAAWEPNWGFVPMTRPEFEQMAEGLRFLVHPEFAFVAEVGGEPAGFCLALPDYAHTLKRIGNGRLLPTGLLHLLRDRRRLTSGRIMALGVKKQFRSTGLFALFANELYRRGRAQGKTTGEASWILEDNELMNRPLRALGARAYRRWRMYERAFD